MIQLIECNGGVRVMYLHFWYAVFPRKAGKAVNIFPSYASEKFIDKAGNVSIFF